MYVTPATGAIAPGKRQPEAVDAGDPDRDVAVEGDQAPVELELPEDLRALLLR